MSIDSNCLENNPGINCAGRKCNKIAKHYLQIKYIKKSGWFCDSCAEDLKENDLVIIEPLHSTDELVDRKTKKTINSGFGRL